MGTFSGNRTTRKGRRSPGADRALARRSMHGTFASSLGRLTRALQMESYPKFHNEVGVSIVRIGCREFKCIGDKPPQDHPVGSKIEAIEGTVPARHSLVGRPAAAGLMPQRIADLAISVVGLLRITLAKTGAA